MTIQSELKTVFEDGDIPTGDEFGRLIDTFALSSTETTVRANSAYWDLNATDITEIAAASGGWNSTETTVNANSAYWDLNAQDITEVAQASGGWNSTQTTVNANSSDWATHTDISDVIAISGNWNSTHTTVNLNSAMWAGLGAKSPITIIDSNSYSVPLGESGTTYVVSSDPGTGNIDFILPNGTLANLGTNYTFSKYTTAVMITLSADSNHRIEDSGLGATFYAGSGTSSVSAQEFASCKVELILPDTWHVLHGRKTWSSTEWI